jgi:hypothetical protein
MRRSLVSAFCLVVAACCLLLATPPLAQAQTAIAVDITKAVLEWQWVRGTQAGVNDGIPTEWRFYCGSSAGAPGAVAIKIPYVAAASGTTYSTPIKTVTPAVGTYFCSVAAANQFGETGRSNEVTFQAGVVPSAATNLLIKSQ